MSTSTLSCIDFSFFVKCLEKRQRREARIKPVLTTYLDLLCTSSTGAAEEEELNSFFNRLDEGHKRRFLTVAYQLSRVPACSREEKFQEIMADINDAIKEEIRHDGAAVANMIGAADAIEKGKELILYLAEGIDRRIQSAKDQMVSMGFCEFRGKNADAIFRNLIPYNPDAL